MTREPIATTGNSPEAGARRRPARPEATPLVQGLEALRGRLDRIEALAIERADAAPPGEPSEAERALRQKVAELEERLGRAQAEARRRDQEWKAALEQLEGDRKLLAEAWERLERERIDAAGAPAAAPRPYAPHPAPAVPVAARPAVTTEADEAVAHAVLKQFQALRGDVRRNGAGRHPRR
jgi:hypothetical protein